MAIQPLKKWFRSQKDVAPTYKHRHFLHTLMPEKVRELMIYSEAEPLSDLMPSLEKKRVLFLNDGEHKYFYKKLQAIDPTYLVNYVFGDQEIEKNELKSPTVIGDLDTLALSNLHFDVIVCPFSLLSHKVSADVISEISKKLKNGGRIVLSVRHPAFDQVYIKENPAEYAFPDTSVSNYFSVLKKNNLYTEEIAEGRVGPMVKPLFASKDGHDHYADYFGLPLTYIMRAVKFVKKS